MIIQKILEGMIMNRKWNIFRDSVVSYPRWKKTVNLRRARKEPSSFCHQLQTTRPFTSHLTENLARTIDVIEVEWVVYLPVWVPTDSPRKSLTARKAKENSASIPNETALVHWRVDTPHLTTEITVSVWGKHADTIPRSQGIYRCSRLEEIPNKFIIIMITAKLPNKITKWT